MVPFAKASCEDATWANVGADMSAPQRSPACGWPSGRAMMVRTASQAFTAARERGYGHRLRQLARASAAAQPIGELGPVRQAVCSVTLPLGATAGLGRGRCKGLGGIKRASGGRVMSASLSCPSRGILERFLLGALRADELQSLVDHVEHCSSCVDTLNRLKS